MTLFPVYNGPLTYMETLGAGTVMTEHKVTRNIVTGMYLD